MRLKHILWIKKGLQILKIMRRLVAFPRIAYYEVHGQEPYIEKLFLFTNGLVVRVASDGIKHIPPPESRLPEIDKFIMVVDTEGGALNRVWKILTVYGDTWEFSPVTETWRRM